MTHQPPSATTTSQPTASAAAPTKAAATIMQQVASQISYSYFLYGYTREDLMSEAYIMCLDAYSRYDGQRNLRSFLWAHTNNRMKNRVRDLYGTPAKREVRACGNIPLDGLVVDDKPTTAGDYLNLNMDSKDFLYKLKKLVPTHLRTPFLRIINGCRVNSSRKSTLMAWLYNNTLIPHLDGQLSD